MSFFKDNSESAINLKNMFEKYNNANLNNNCDLTEMALSLAMNLSGVDPQYFYEAGVKDMYDAGAKLMKGLKIQNNNNSDDALPLLISTLNSSSNSSNNNGRWGFDQNLSILARTPLQQLNALVAAKCQKQLQCGQMTPLSVSPSSSTTSSGFVSEDSSSQRDENTSMPPGVASFFNLKFSTRIDEFQCQPGRNQAKDYFAPEYNYKSTMMAVNSKSSTRFQPIGTKRSGSPVRSTHLLNSTTTSTNASLYDSNDNNSTLTPFNSNENNTVTLASEFSTLLSEANSYSVWSDNTADQTLVGPHQAKTEIIYQSRDILNLGANIQMSHWQFRPAQLPVGNTRMFFENRSQYHRLATGFEQVEDQYVECRQCKFYSPISN